MSAIAAALLGFGSGCTDGARRPSVAEAPVTADEVVLTGQACTPGGKHQEHGTFACTTCHLCAGTLAFDPAVAGSAAAFDATAKTCSNVACHSVPAGVFTFNKYDPNLDAVVPVYVPYGGAGAAPPPYWYAAAGQGCGACHGYPPTYNGVAYPWHSGQHGYGIGNGNACQLCHPDATGAYVYGGLPSYVNTSGGLISSCAPGTYCSAPGTITNASLHRNGALNVTLTFTSRCFGCH